MITDNGVEILSKYLVGQASSYASYIAVGSGARPTSNSQAINVIPSASTVTVAIVSAVAPFEATLTITGTGSDDYWSYLEVGDIITGSQVNNSPTYTLSGGTVTVKSINSPKQISVYSTSAMIAGTNVVSNVKASSSLTSKSLSSKTSLDFETARFPITSRSYVVEKQTVTPSSLSIISPTQITVTISSGHPFGIGDNVNVIGVLIPVSGPTANIEVNGLYTITAIGSTSFTAQILPGATTNWDSSHYSTPYTGFSYNNNLFYATVFTKQVSLTAEMSDTSRYNISELGVYSLGSNQYSPSGNSRMLLTFAENEGWQYYSNSSTSFSDVTAITSVTLPLTIPNFVSTSNAFWSDTYRKLRQEKPRILEDGLIVQGALSEWDGLASNFLSTSNYLVLSDPGINLSKSSGLDQVRLAYSIINAVSTPTALPTELRIQFEFTCSNGIDNAKLLFSNTGGTTVIYPNRYNVLVKNISDFQSTSGFDWSKVTSLKVYASLEASGTPTNDYAIVLDGLRFENTGTENPLYALTAYTMVNNTTATTIDKASNSNDLINFRMDLAVGK